MDLWEWNTADNAPINQFTRNDLAAQQWRFVDVGGGFYQVRNVHSNKVLTLADSNDGTQLVVQRRRQRQPAPALPARRLGRRVRAVHQPAPPARPSTCGSGPMADGGRVAQFTDLDGANQQWSLNVLGAGGGGGGGGGNTTGLVGWAHPGRRHHRRWQRRGHHRHQRVGPDQRDRPAPTPRSSGSPAPSPAPACCGSAPTRPSSATPARRSPAAASTSPTASNVIIRNLNFRGWNDDAINVQYSTRVWIDHNSLTDGFDGAIDIKRGSDFVTVSWNRIFGHDKSMLLGHADDNAGEDVGHLRVTYHHNWFDGTDQRHPRVRFGNPVHVYNNFYGGVTSYGVASTEGAGVLVEGNYFENTDDPFHLGEGDSGPGTPGGPQQPLRRLRHRPDRRLGGQHPVLVLARHRGQRQVHRDGRRRRRTDHRLTPTR